MSDRPLPSPPPSLLAPSDGTDGRAHQESLRKVLAALARPSHDLHRVLDESADALVAFDAGRTILAANAAAERLFGYGRGELEGRSTDVLIPARLRQSDAPPMAEMVEPMQVELPGLTRLGAERQIAWCFGSARRGDQLLFVMTVRDLADVERALARLRDSENRFQLFVNGVKDCAIYMLTEDGLVSSWNAGAARVEGWTAEEVVGHPYDIFFTAEDRDAGVPRQLLAVAAQEGSVQTDGWRVRKDGSRFWVEGSITALRAPDGEIRGFAKITRDLTAKLRAEEAERHLIAERAARQAAEEAEQKLRLSEERVSRLQRITAALLQAVAPDEAAGVVLNELSEAIGAAGSALYLLSADRQTLELLQQCGHPEKAIHGFESLPLDAHMPLTDAGRERAPAFFEDFEACAARYPALRDAIGAGGFEASVALPLVARGDLLGVLGIRFSAPHAFEATERAHLLTIGGICAQALDRARLFAAESHARNAAEAASRAKDEFLAMLGHELRNPLAPIATAAELLKLKGGENIRRERQVIERQVAHLRRLVDDLLDVSRVARGMVSLSREAIDVSDIIGRAIELARPLIEERGQELSVAIPQEGLVLDADPLRLVQVVTNLLTNAAKYSPRGGRITVRAHHEAGEAVISVLDEGEGIAPELLPRVFELFVQGPRTMARSEGGLGLGLALVQSLVTMHGGRVVAKSDGVGKGSEFVVRLPAAVGGAPRSAPAPASGPVGGQARKRILLVDDNADAREMLAAVLGAMGHEVVSAGDGPTALAKLDGFHADVAILDLGLPGMDGFELAKRIATLRRETSPRLVALTGYGREVDMERTRAVGFACHLVKPVNVPVLVSALA